MSVVGPVYQYTLGKFIGKVTVKQHFPPEAKQRMQLWLTTLISAYEII